MLNLLLFKISYSMKLIKFFSTLILILIIGNSYGQNTNSDYYDLRIKKLLDSKDVNYTITKNNNFRINVITEDEPKKRTQAVYVNSVTSKWYEYEIREITSTALQLKKNDVRIKMLYELLQKNGNIKAGAWEVNEYESDKEFYYLTFSLKVSTNINADDLKSLLFLVANEADRIEKLYGNGNDEY